jgi:hypothetical protein
MCVALDDLLSRTTNPAAILAAISDLSLALDRRQAERESQASSPAPAADPPP